MPCKVHSQTCRTVLSSRRAARWIAVVILAISVSAELGVSMSAAAPTSGNLSGIWILTDTGSPSRGFGAEWWVFTSGAGAVNGTLTTNPYGGGPSDVYATITGTAEGGSVHLVVTYLERPYIHELIETYVGTLSASGNSMSGIQSSNRPQAGTNPWTAERVPASVGATSCTVPKLKGQTLAKAKTLIKRAGCALGKVSGPSRNREHRHVVSQKPAARQTVSAGTKVNVQVR